MRCRENAAAATSETNTSAKTDPVFRCDEVDELPNEY